MENRLQKWLYYNKVNKLEIKNAKTETETETPKESHNVMKKEIHKNPNESTKSNNEQKHL